MRALTVRHFTREFPRVRGETLTVTDRGQVIGTWVPRPKKRKPINFEQRIKQDFKTMLPFTGAELLREGKKR